MSERGVVFIVDHDAASADQLQELLEQNGYEVNRASEGKNALQEITALRPDLVLLDVRLPDANPFGLFEDLRQDPQGRDIPLIFMATLEDTDVQAKGLQSADDLIVKPFDAREALARIERQVTVSKVRLALRESEAKFRSVMESAIDAIISGDAAGRIRSWNSAATQLFGFTEAEVIGEPIELIIPNATTRVIRRVSAE